MPSAVDGPSLKTSIRYSNSSPAVRSGFPGSPETSDLRTRRSGAVTIGSAVLPFGLPALLFVTSGSKVVVVAVAVLTRLPEAPGSTSTSTSIWIEVWSPSAPRLQVSVPPAGAPSWVHNPTGLLALMNTAFGGITSTTVTAFAAAGPLLKIVTA